ncbi:MAG: hypothetical protein HGB03_03740 [Candidatus Yonathbacteria bacterium]|nr:hypothetical protein [Candidatus Yonathbacteria bacterium]
MKKIVIFGALMGSFVVNTALAAVGDEWLDRPMKEEQSGMESVREDILRFAKKEYAHIGRNPFYKGGIPEALRKGELGKYELMLKASLDAYGINTAELHKEFVRIADGKARRATLRNGDPFFAINQKGGGFVKGPRLPNGSRGLLKNETGEDISGVLLVLMEGAEDDNGGAHPVIILVADECGNAATLPPRPEQSRQDVAVVRGRREEERRSPRREYREERGGSLAEVIVPLAGMILREVHASSSASLRYADGPRGVRVVGVKRICRNGRWFDAVHYSNGATRLVPVNNNERRERQMSSQRRTMRFTPYQYRGR